jgi:hypothetical protein
VLGKDLVDCFITEEYRTAVKAVFDDALQGKEAANFEFPLFTKDQQRVDVLLNATTRRDVKGTILGVIGVGTVPPPPSCLSLFFTLRVTASSDSLIS